MKIEDADDDDYDQRSVVGLCVIVLEADNGRSNFDFRFPLIAQQHVHERD